MANSPVDRDVSYMQQVWGTTSLTSDYWSLPKETNDPEEMVLREVMHDNLNRKKENLQE